MEWPGQRGDGQSRALPLRISSPISLQGAGVFGVGIHLVDERRRGSNSAEEAQRRGSVFPKASRSAGRLGVASQSRPLRGRLAGDGGFRGRLWWWCRSCEGHRGVGGRPQDALVTKGGISHTQGQRRAVDWPRGPSSHTRPPQRVGRSPSRPPQGPAKCYLQLSPSHSHLDGKKETHYLA